MNKYILFICRKASNITIRRYLYLANIFKLYNYNSVFFGIDNAEKSYIEECKQELKNYFNINLDSLSYQYIKFDNLNNYNVSNERIDKIDKLNIESPLKELFCNNHLHSSVKRVSELFTSFDSFISSNNYVLAFYDISILWNLNVLLDVCQYKNIKTISLEHAEGMTKVYSNFTPVADYYIAYGVYSYKNLLKMGVKKDCIWEMGNIDDDFIKKLSFNTERSGILLIFKPFKIKGAEELNSKLLFKTIELFPNEKIFIKLHPSVYDIEKTKKIIEKWINNNKNIKIVNIYEPMAVSLTKSNKCISFNSFSIIEAIKMNNKILCIEGMQNFAYPKWKYISNEIDVMNIEDYLNLKHYKWKDMSTESSLKLLSFFRYNNINISEKIVLKSIDLIRNTK